MAKTLVTFTGPSGCGKSTVVRLLYTKYPDVFSEMVSTTTRAPRALEVEGVAYYFVSQDEFESRSVAGMFLEEVLYNGTRYGIEKREVNRVLMQGCTPLLIVEPHGARQIRERYAGPLIQLFIKPPSEEHLRTWMAGRGDSPETIERRIQLDRSVFNPNDGHPWTKVIENNDLETVCGEILTLLGMEDLQTRRSTYPCDERLSSA